MSGPDWPGQLAAALTLLERRSRTDGNQLPDQFYTDAREAVRQAWTSAGKRSDAQSDDVCSREHMDDRLLLTKAEAASLLNCSPRTIGEMLGDGRLHRVEGMGRLCRVARAEVEALAGRSGFRARIVSKNADPGRRRGARTPFLSGSSMALLGAEPAPPAARIGSAR